VTEAIVALLVIAGIGLAFYGCRAYSPDRGVAGVGVSAACLGGAIILMALSTI